MTQTWYNEANVKEPGSVVLRNWIADRQAARAQPQGSTQTSKIVQGTEMFDVLTGGAGFGGVGIQVTEKTAMAVGAVYACVALIGGALASLPFHFYEKTDNGRERYDTDLWWLFNESPSDNWSAAAAWQFTAQSIMLKGDGFWRIHRKSRFTNAISHLEPYHPDRVQVVREKGRTFYVLFTDEGTIEAVDAADMLHFPGVGFDGKRSLTPLRAAVRSAAGIAMAADEYAASFFRNGMRPDFALSTEKSLSKEQVDQLRTTWSQRHQGPTNAHLPAVLTGGLKVEQLTMTAEDAQLIMTRQFQVQDIARIYGVPSHMIGSTEKTTSWGTGIEQQSIGFVRYTLRRYIDSIAQEINRKLWPRSKKYYGEHSVDSLMDGDSKAQAEFFTKALGGPGNQGWMFVNEVRRLKNLPPIDAEWANTVVQAAGPAVSPAPDNIDPINPETQDESTA